MSADLRAWIETHKCQIYRCPNLASATLTVAIPGGATGEIRVCPGHAEDPYASFEMSA